MRTKLGIVAFLVALLASACTSATSDRNSESELAGPPPHADVAWRDNSAKPISNVSQLADDVVAYYGAVDGRIVLRALDPTDGALLWERGSAINSWFLPYPVDGGIAVVAADLHLACHFTSGIVGRPHYSDPMNAGFDAEGILVDTGEIVWSQAAGTSETADIELRSDTSGRVALEHRDQIQLVELATGDTEEPENPVLWASAADLTIGKTTVSRGAVLKPTLGGKPTTELPWPLPEHLGTTVGDLHLVPQPNAVVAYRQAT